MGNLLFTPEQKQTQGGNTEVPIDYSSVTSDTNPKEHHDVLEESVEPNTTYIGEQSVASSISETTTTNDKSADVECCYGCEKSGVTLYTRGMMQIRVCGDCID